MLSHSQERGPMPTGFQKGATVVGPYLQGATVPAPSLQRASVPNHCLQGAPVPDLFHRERLRQPFPTGSTCARQFPTESTSYSPFPTGKGQFHVH